MRKDAMQLLLGAIGETDGDSVMQGAVPDGATFSLDEASDVVTSISPAIGETVPALPEAPAAVPAPRGARAVIPGGGMVPRNQLVTLSQPELGPTQVSTASNRERTPVAASLYAKSFPRPTAKDSRPAIGEQAVLTAPRLSPKTGNPDRAPSRPASSRVARVEAAAPPGIKGNREVLTTSHQTDRPRRSDSAPAAAGLPKPVPILTQTRAPLPDSAIPGTPSKELPPDGNPRLAVTSLHLRPPGSTVPAIRTATSEGMTRAKAPVRSNISMDNDASALARNEDGQKTPSQKDPGPIPRIPPTRDGATRPAAAPALANISLPDRASHGSSPNLPGGQFKEVPPEPQNSTNRPASVRGPDPSGIPDRPANLSRLKASDQLAPGGRDLIPAQADAPAPTRILPPATSQTGPFVPAPFIPPEPVRGTPLESLSPVVLGSVDVVAPDRSQEAPRTQLDTRSEVARAPLQQIADTVRRMPEGAVEVRLSPEELGRVRLTVSPAETGLTVTIHAERHETLDLLRRHADTLIADLAAKGFSGTNLDFGRDDKPDTDASASPSDGPQASDADPPPEAVRQQSPERLPSGRSIDLRL